MTSSREELGELHSALARKFKLMLEHGDELTAAQIKEIRSFLADNGITAIKEASAPLRSLVDSMPFKDPLEDVG